MARVIEDLYQILIINLDGANQHSASVRYCVENV